MAISKSTPFKKSSTSKGFTLLEMMLVVLIMLIFFGMSLKLYSNLNLQKKLESETKYVVEILELAKKKTISGDKTGLDDSCILSGYKIVYTQDSYALFAICPDDRAVGKEFASSYGISLSGDGTNEVVFNPFGVGAVPACVIITNTATNKCRMITVLQSASISYAAESQSCVCP